MFRVVAFYTKDTPYEQEAKELVASAKAVGLDVALGIYPDTGEWVRNAGWKPILIKEMLNSYDEDLLYVDVDARFRSYPKLLDTICGDICVHYRGGRELLSGTIYFRNNRAVRRLVDDWVFEQAKYPREWDQRTLQRILEKSDLQVTQLPPSYTQIFDTMAHHGEPVIEHMQASRRYRNVHKPLIVGGVRVRRSYDGALYLVRRNRDVEKYLDTHYTRVPNQLRWWPYQASMQIDGDYFKDRGCYVIGKGPSLDNLDASHFGRADWPVLCLNDSIHVVERLHLSNPVYAVQQDARLASQCYPKNGQLLVSVQAAKWYDNKPYVHIFDARQYGLQQNGLSACVAIKIAQSLGSTNFVLMCFDACVNGKLEYAKAVGYSAHRGGKLERFKAHKQRILEVLDVPFTWTIPTKLD